MKYKVRIKRAPMQKARTGAQVDYGLSTPVTAMGGADYGRQPKVSVKGVLETENIDGDTVNSFGAAPTISKGFSFWGKEAFPFLAVPVKVSLDADENTYETSTAVAAGITGRLPMEGYENLVYNIETNMSLRNSYTGFVMGISLPIQ